MESETYPSGTVRSLLQTDLLTPRTREVLEARLDQSKSAAPRFFDTQHLAILRAVCARLIPQPERPVPIDLASSIDERLADDKADGWRYADMPPDREAYLQGLRGLDEQAQLRFGVEFVALDGAQQDLILLAVQQGKVEGKAWDTLPPKRFFEELLAEVAECYYSHPLAYEEIGFVGFADAHGWQAIGLNELEPHEPRPMRDTPQDPTEAGTRDAPPPA